MILHHGHSYMAAAVLWGAAQCSATVQNSDQWQLARVPMGASIGCRLQAFKQTAGTCNIDELSDHDQDCGACASMTMRIYIAALTHCVLHI